jgi:hypothetical protein
MELFLYTHFYRVLCSVLNNMVTVGIMNLREVSYISLNIQCAQKETQHINEAFPFNVLSTRVAYSFRREL